MILHGGRSLACGWGKKNITTWGVCMTMKVACRDPLRLSCRADGCDQHEREDGAGGTSKLHCTGLLLKDVCCHMQRRCFDSESVPPSELPSLHCSILHSLFHPILWTLGTGSCWNSLPENVWHYCNPWTPALPPSCQNKPWIPLVPFLNEYSFN